MDKKIENNIPLMEKHSIPFLDRLECYGPWFFLKSFNAKGNSFWNTFKAYNIFFSRIKPNSTIEVLSEPVFYSDNI